MPQVPRVGGGSGCDVDTFLGFVKSDLIPPLNIVDTSQCSAATMHRNEQAATAFRLVAKGSMFKPHFVAVMLDSFRDHFRSAFFGDRRAFSIPKDGERFVGVRFG